ncbi:HD domain-containing protein [Desulfobacca acetoxidans]
MAKNIHEIRDSIHVFIRLDDQERKVLDSRPFQRLRHIHQLALTYLIYPGATHKRFDHSLGVMELASRIFDVVTNPDNVTDDVRNLLPELKDQNKLQYWRLVLRMAALCHDIGHLPFSHAAEKELLPEGWNHEKLTREIIQSSEMQEIWNSITPPLRANDITKLAVGPKEASDLTFTDWETILSEIIVGDAFGADRMDYLLRDSHHIGVVYGKFDHYRLIDTLRILSFLPSCEKGASVEPALGVEEGGIHTSEALMLARYFMYSQVYCHPVRRIYDIHLKDFLKEWLQNGKFSTDIQQHIKMTDNEITVAFMEEAFDESRPIHQHARRILRREHFKVIYERNPNDVRINPEAGQSVFNALKQEFGEEHFRRDRYPQKGGAPDFPVRLRGGQIVSSLAKSDTLKRVPIVSVDYVFCDRKIYGRADEWLKAIRDKIILPKREEDINGQN